MSCRGWALCFFDGLEVNKKIGAVHSVPHSTDRAADPLLFGGVVLTHRCDHSITAMNKNGKSAEMMIPSKVIWILLCITYKFHCK